MTHRQQVAVDVFGEPQMPGRGRMNEIGQKIDAEGQFAEAENGLEAAIKLDSTEYTLNALAWLKATCPEEKYRDGKIAVELAKKAIEKAGKASR